MVIRFVRNQSVVKWILLSILAFTAFSACENSPDFERTRDYSRPETILLSWFYWEAFRVGSGFLNPIGSFPQCTLGGLSLEYDDFVEKDAFDLACQRVDAIFEKYGIILSSDVDELPNPEREHFNRELQIVTNTLYDDLKCGLGKQVFQDENDKWRCKERDSGSP